MFCSVFLTKLPGAPSHRTGVLDMSERVVHRQLTAVRTGRISVRRLGVVVQDYDVHTTPAGKNRQVYNCRGRATSVDYCIVLQAKAIFLRASRHGTRNYGRAYDAAPPHEQLLSSR